MRSVGRIAIVGIGCRYPDASNPAELWQTILGQRRAFRSFPAQRLSTGYQGSSDAVDLTYVTHAGLLRGWEFDRQRFGVPGPLHRAADHTHWLALHTAAEALADAGYPEGEGLDRNEVGVILGNSLTGEFSRAAMLRVRWPFLHGAAATALAEAGVADEQAVRVIGRLEQLIKQPFPEPGDETLAGALSNTIAGRVCNHFDFHGTGYTVDGACASSLLAVMTACRALLDGELSFALAGGVDLSLDPFELVGFARLGALATDEMRVYDARPTGFLPGEGCGIVALMRAEDASRLGLRVYAELVGWGSSSDGAGGLTRPGVAGQARALQRAYQMADLPPATVGLVEGHGTGTAVGDRVELEVLTGVRGAGSAKAALGTVKANIGHTKAAAGVAGLIKATLAVHHRVLPPTTGCSAPHEILRRPETPLRLLDAPEPWSEMVPTAAVSSMGFGGINTHVVLQGRPAATPTALAPSTRYWGRSAPEYDIVVVEAGSAAELGQRLSTLAEFGAALSTAELHDLACTLHRGTSRTAQARAVLVADRPDALSWAAERAAQQLAHWDADLVVDEAGGYVLGRGGPASVGLLLPGQAAPVRSRLDWWAEGLAVPPLPAGAMVRDGEVDTEVAQVAIVRQTLAGLAWLDALGCVPAAAVGHSLGEISALVWAGALSPADGLLLAARRGKVMAEHGRPGTSMASLAAGDSIVTDLLRGTAAVVSGWNAPTQTAVSGSRRDIEIVLERARKAGVAATELTVSHAFHSSAMRPATDPLRAALREFSIGAPTGAVISTITGRPLSVADDLAELLVEQLTTPVRFAEAVGELAGRCELLVEVGPGTVLAGLAHASEVSVPVVSVDCGGSPFRHAMATAVLAAAGAADLEPWFAGRPYRHLPADQSMVFLSNPCEALPAVDVPTSPVGQHIAVPTAAADTVTPGADPLRALREHLAATLELPIEVVRPDCTLLGDLHLNSLQVVQTVAAVAVALGKETPSSPLSLVDATVRDAASVLAELPDAGAEPAETLVPGVRTWVRAFTHHWEPYQFDDCRLTEPVDAEQGTLTVMLAKDSEVAEVAELLCRLAGEKLERLVLTHHGHPAAAAIGRSVAVECESCAVSVVELPHDHDQVPDPLRRALVQERGYLELRVLPDERVERVITRPHVCSGEAELALGAGDVCLVTGGATGITAYSAAALAEHTGCALVLLGRSPADAPSVVEGLSQLRQRIRAHYLSCDVADEESVRQALALATEYGTIRGLLHGAGVNEPRRMAAVTEESLRNTLRPKVSGLRVLLAAVGEDLRLVVGYGSIIGRRALVGQAAYCVANDWMRVELERWAATHPRCRSHLVEWSVWSGVGMGVRLDVLDSLRRQGVAPIGPEEGTQALLDLLATPAAPVTVLVTGRFPAGSTLRVDGPHRPLLRFGEDLRTHTPGIEVVVDAELSMGDDPYLDEHRIDGMPVLPAVVGLEAMAQAAALVGEPRDAWSFSDVRLSSPVTVDDREPRTVRVAALSEGERVELALRDDGDRFSTDRFTAIVLPADEPPPVTSTGAPPLAAEPHPFYGPLMFHSGRFRRLLDYVELSAFRAIAWIQADPECRWFSDFHSPRLLLGDPGTHDAAIHVLLACAPHRRVLPVGVDRLTMWRSPPAGPLLMRATEREHTASDYVFDVDLVDVDGRAVSRWDGLRLHVVGPLTWDRALPARLVGPLLSRRLIECGFVDAVELVTGVGQRDEGAAASLASALVGHPVEHDGRGVLRVPGRHASASYTAGHVLLALADRAVGIDWQAIPEGDGWNWPELIGEVGWQLAAVIANKTGEANEEAAVRVWSTREALVKLGASPEQPLRVDQVTEDGLVVTSTGTSPGAVQVVTARLSTELAANPVIVAVAVGHGE